MTAERAERADESVPETYVSQELPVTAEKRSEQYRRDARRIAIWSAVWLLMATPLWGWFAYLMFADYGPNVGTTLEPRSLCQGPLLSRFPETDDCRNYDLHQWPALLGILALAVIPTIIAAATMVYAKLLSRLAAACR